jgi:hypothetical protein
MNMVIITKDSPPDVIFINSVGNGEIGSSPVGTWWFDGIGQDAILQDGHEYWTAESVNLNQWDPGEILAGWIRMTPHPVEFHVFTPNGATGYLPVAPTW